MEIRLSQELCEAIGVKVLKPYGIDPQRWNWDKGSDINLANFSTAKNLDLRNLIEPFTVEGGALRTMKGAGLAVRDIGIWLHATKDAAGGIPRTVNQFYSLLKWEFGKLEEQDFFFYESDIRGVPIAQAVAKRHGFIAETEELRALYDATIARYNDNVMEVGRQFLAVGSGSDDLDGNKSSRDGWWSSRTNTIRLDKNGEPSRVVMDVFQENDTETRGGRETYLHDRFWYYEGRRGFTSDGDEEDEEEIEARDDEEDFVPPVVPIHPTCAVFDLRRHVRLQVHIDQLTLYVYDTTLGAKLIMPEDDRTLIEILLAGKSDFADIVAGKGGGAVVLCSGSPGLGKTLTAEVYAEVSQRPLFSVQCSQLGIKPDELEEELLKSFSRAERWNAILLLDEADVYVAPRGSNLLQNAIVGVFLRTLEYYNGVMFMTTNRPDLVDDAIASRCIAMLRYQVPDAANQLRIWNVLSSNSGGMIAESEARKVVKEFPHLSGRDVKNLLKLAMLIAKAQQEKSVTAAMIKFVKRFKPTMDLS
jgi:hypothetical protein